MVVASESWAWSSKDCLIRISKFYDALNKAARRFEPGKVGSAMRKPRPDSSAKGSPRKVFAEMKN